MAEKRRPAGKHPDRKPKRPTAHQEFAKISQLSLEKGIPPKTIRDLVATGKLAHYRFGEETRSRIWIKRAEFDRLMEISRVRL